MENKYFRNPGDLTDKVNTESKHFRPAGDLTSGLESESKFFRPMGDLGDSKSDLTPFRNPEEIVDYFRPAGDLTSGLESESKFFRPLGDLGDSKSDLTPFRNPEEIVDYFRPAGNLNEINKEKIEKINNNEEKINNIDKISDYLLTVVSGKKYDSVCELGVLMGAGRMVVSLEELMKMVDEGYNIVSARVINADRNMIEVEFQRYEYDKEKMERWRRF